MASNPFEDIVGADFSCLKEPPLSPDKCPGSSFTQGGPQLDNEIGEWYCPACGVVFDTDEAPEDEFFDDDEDEAFDNDEDFVAEGDRLIRQTPEEKARVDRYNALNAMSADLGPINLRLSMYMEANATMIIDTLRELELGGEPSFDGRLLKPKVLAVALFMTKRRLDAETYRVLKVNQRTVDTMLKALTQLRPSVGESDPMSENIRFVGNTLNLPPGIITIVTEQYEEAGRPPNRETDWRTRAAAWIYLMTKDLGLKVTKAKLKAVGGVKKNAFDRAVESYESSMANRNKDDEGVELLDD